MSDLDEDDGSDLKAVFAQGSMLLSRKQVRLMLGSHNKKTMREKR